LICRFGKSSAQEPFRFHRRSVVNRCIILGHLGVDFLWIKAGHVIHGC
jgi:hypothetical protein